MEYVPTINGKLSKEAAVFHSGWCFDLADLRSNHRWISGGIYQSILWSVVGCVTTVAQKHCGSETLWSRNTVVQKYSGSEIQWLRLQY